MLIPAVKKVIDVSSAAGVESFVIGMPHRYLFFEIFGSVINFFLYN